MPTHTFRFKSAFQFPFHIGKNALNIVQHGDKFELRINNQSFTHLYDNGKLLALTILQRGPRGTSTTKRETRMTPTKLKTMLSTMSKRRKVKS